MFQSKQVREILRQALELIQFDHLDVNEKKNHRDLVTNMDVSIQQFITDELTMLYPDATIFGEESAQQVDVYGKDVWIIDPIDGTGNFVKQHANFGMLVAHAQFGKLIEGYIASGITKDIYWFNLEDGVYCNDRQLVISQDLTLSESFIYCNPLAAIEEEKVADVFKEAFGVRYIGSCALDALFVINQQAGCCMAFKAEVWDVACSILLAQLLDLRCVNLDGSQRLLHQSGPYIFGTPSCVNAVLEILHG